MKNGEVHSEEWITDAREYWWNNDYIDLLLKRYDLKNISSMADIGCGKGYMTFKLQPLLPNLSYAFGLDIENEHIIDAQKKSTTINNISFDFQVGNAESIPLPDNSVDLAVCQTLLLHVNNPLKVIKELKRIVKKNGKIIAIETNNAINNLVKNSFLNETYNNPFNSIEKDIEQIEFDLTVFKGIHALGEGNVAIGDIVPKLFCDAGLKNIDVSIAEKACCLIPPYDTQEKKYRAQELLDWINNSSAEYDKEQMARYFIAGGGNIDRFNTLWNSQQKEIAKIKTAIENEEYIMPGGALMYIVVGKK